jgi:hypothetical protein
MTERWSVITTPWTRIAGSQPGKSTVPMSVVETVRLNTETGCTARMAIEVSRARTRPIVSRTIRSSAACMIDFVSTYVPPHDTGFQRCADIEGWNDEWEILYPILRGGRSKTGVALQRHAGRRSLAGELAARHEPQTRRAVSTTSRSLAS